MKWANKNRANPITKAAMREMLPIIIADERHTGAEFPLEKPWAEPLYRYSASVSDLYWLVEEKQRPTTLRRNNRVQIVQLEELFSFSFKN